MSCLSIIAAGMICGSPIAVDGDTLRFGRQYVRLWGVDAEEMDEPNGPRARAILRDIVDGRHIKCTVVTIDNYGRSVGRCTVGSIDVNREVIARGGALDCKRYSGGAFRSAEPSTSRTKLSQKPYC